MPSIAPRGGDGIGSKGEMKTVVVTSGLIAAQGKVLLAQRREGDDQGLLCEFPGGQVEEGEDPRQALERELQEELGIDVEVGRIFDAAFHFYTSRPILLIVYCCRIQSGSPSPLGCQDLRWVSPEEMRRLAMPAADEPIHERLMLCEGDRGFWKSF